MKTEKDTFLYAQRKRVERIYGLTGGDYADLDSHDTAVLLAMNDHSKADGTDMYPSVETLALMTLLSRSSIRRSLSRLVACGLLVVESRQRQHAPVVYRFGTVLLDKSDKTLRACLGEKQFLRELRGASRSATRTRQSVQPASQSALPDSLGRLEVHRGAVARSGKNPGSGQSRCGPG